jgi:hypothetical protein
MGYKGKGNYDERDKLFQQSFDGKPVNRQEVKKNLDNLFGSGPKQAQEARCANGHTWIRDFDRKTKCAYCKTLKPSDASAPSK